MRALLERPLYPLVPLPPALEKDVIRMIQIGLSGCNGRMGQVVTRMAASSQKLRVSVGIDVNSVKLSDYPVFASVNELTETPDVLVDFSNPASLPGLLSYGLAHRVPLVLCTTGLSEEQVNAVKEASASLPIFRSGNMSLGINLVMELLQKAGQVLSDGYDVEIIERHHNQKIDAPSGTALMLADAVSSVLPYDPVYTYDRHSVRQKRDPKEIGIHSVRGGTIVGEHEVIFAGPDEVIEIKHTAYSREVFAAGALNAAEFMAGVAKPGLYTMADVVRAKQRL